MSDSNSGDVLLAFLLGGIVGAAIGILYAPRSGKETRERLHGLGDDLTDKLKDMGGDVIEKAEHVVHDVKDKIMSQKDKIESAFEAGKKAYEHK
ncbi:MAG TPA: hypothetical protein DEE98_06920 [Elusimicrobia bacterium]|nr:MAG: hypothetical protein A2278_01310 [Elusimicrobia bacterium RIFOXYA12_FULL_49_49]OGS09901.1 MAG: hypothetical protein A2204_07100 [Elusimicrobia bacterium RIFOXYA1_FULL_47_7]OGS10006.1 MAG: hypothetical protein A2386_05895 [Elusimicrobia bacterium RIFOXYB1_FULL_48_9]OGS15476.1 MAG: hypothetical protein A2251_03045 [Elusimicrobia bacterium RIFOXYA2_FULL_47_53]OGS26971.1 MAG: hypothetical protein A2339_04560 [Elusimicrobia bacterium RIFOXYB12_FULL_50_12]OGS30916.1 MAG: hypothetical protein